MGEASALFNWMCLVAMRNSCIMSVFEKCCVALNVHAFGRRLAQITNRQIRSNVSSKRCSREHIVSYIIHRLRGYYLRHSHHSIVFTVRCSLKSTNKNNGRKTHNRQTLFQPVSHLQRIIFISAKFRAAPNIPRCHEN